MKIDASHPDKVGVNFSADEKTREYERRACRNIFPGLIWKQGVWGALRGPNCFFKFVNDRLPNSLSPTLNEVFYEPYLVPSGSRLS